MNKRNSAGISLTFRGGGGEGGVCVEQAEHFAESILLERQDGVSWRTREKAYCTKA